MSLNKIFKAFLIALLSVMISHAPEAVASEVATSPNVMIPTMAVVDSMSRGELEEKVREFLGREDLQNELQKLGLDPREAAQRLATLSQDELKQLASQMDQAKYGGDVVGILVVVLLVLVIIYFAKRV